MFVCKQCQVSSQTNRSQGQRATVDPVSYASSHTSQGVS